MPFGVVKPQRLPKLLAELPVPEQPAAVGDPEHPDEPSSEPRQTPDRAERRGPDRPRGERGGEGRAGEQVDHHALTPLVSSKQGPGLGHRHQGARPRQLSGHLSELPRSRAIGKGEPSPRGWARVSFRGVEAGWFVYVVECRDGTLYCGITTDLDRRLALHDRGLGARYTRGRGPVALVAKCGPLPRSDALRLERKVKRLPRERKAPFVGGHLPASG